MKKQENLKEMLKGRLVDIDKQINNFEPKFHLTYSAFDAYLDEHYKPITIHAYAFMPSKVLMLNMDAYLEMFTWWASGVDKEEIPEYIQLKDEREQTLDWLEELS